MSKYRLTLEKAMHKPLNIDTIVPSNDGWKDSVEVSDVDDIIDYKPFIPMERADFIYRRLGHITINPHDDENVEALLKTYVLLNEIDINIPSREYVNYNDSTVDSFINELIDIAIIKRDVVCNKNFIDPTGYNMYNSAQNLFLLLGERGCGKTFFLNYILAKYYYLFEEKKIIWVRINLANDFNGNDDLRHRINAQIVKISMRYYDTKSNFYKTKKLPLNIAEYLISYINDSIVSKETKIELEKKVLQMINNFHKKVGEEKISPDLVPKELATPVFQYIIEKGYSFIVVLDGLDRLEVTTYHHQRFRNLYKQTIAMAQSQEDCPMSLVLVTRTNTYDTQPSVEVADPFANYCYKIKKIHSISFEHILNKRISYITKKVKTLAPTYSWDISDWPNHIIDFTNYLMESPQSTNEIIPGKDILNGFGDNRRAQMQSTQLIYSMYLRFQKEKAYLLLEALIKDRNIFPPKHFRYFQSPDGRWTREIGSKPIHENHLLPSIFVQPYINYNEEKIESVPIRHGMILGLRIMQLLCAQEIIIKENNNGIIERLSVKEIGEFLKTLWDYSPKIVYNYLEEFEEFELIRLKGNDFYLHSEMQNCTIIPLIKLNIILNKYIYDIAYVNLASMRIPLSNNAFIKNNFFKTAYIDPTKERKNQLYEYIKVKITNSISFFRLFSAINSEQQIIFKNSQKRINNIRLKRIVETACSRSDKMNNIFSLPQIMKDLYIEQMEKVIISVKEREETLIEHINNYTLNN